MTEQFDKRIGVLAPQRTDDLVRGTIDYIGRPFTWQAAWIIEDGPYEGQWAWSPIPTDDTQPGDLPPFVWVPECDIEFTPMTPAECETVRQQESVDQG